MIKNGEATIIISNPQSQASPYIVKKRHQDNQKILEWGGWRGRGHTKLLEIIERM